ncbi:hypothetical protein GOP47_0002617 [Adiantum capillus-veneris]|uniref:PRISE-like Rossmann-fold domain-containing protein n=1 Tax=Adiantum capillus-veneris TaxID=13818 RepID=A0A9D4VAP7_ADICA|nr:hypothetical protein GOP47_0002617 [Adiantum capillus-veneris]
MGGWYSWWTGRIGFDESQGEIRDNGRPKVALVIGITGIVGTSLAKILRRSDAPGGPWKVYGVAVGLSRGGLQTLLLSTFSAISTEERNCHDNGKMFQNVLDALLPNAPRLQHIVLQTGGKHYLGPFALAGKIPAHEPPFKEDMPRLPVPNFYYTLEDILFKTVKKKEGLTWSVHRPNAILGFSPWSLMNILGGLAVYAAICKREGLPFRYPGNRATWEQFGDASDAELIAEQELWACLDPNGKNQAFNVSNGDVFNYKRVWHLLAGKFGLEVAPYNGQPISMKEVMKNKGPVWDAMVEEHDLVPTKLDDVGNWWVVDFTLNTPAPMISNPNKAKELGFLGFCNTETSILHWVDKMRCKKIIP